MYVGQEDPAQVFALASVWLLFLGFGSSACLVPVVYTFGQAFKDAIDSGLSTGSQAPVLELIAMMNGMLVMMLGSMIGYPVASAAGNNLISRFIQLESSHSHALKIVLHFPFPPFLNSNSWSS